MGRTVTPKYAVHVRTSDGSHMDPFAWQVRAQYGRPGDGRPNSANLVRWVESYNKSFEPGGVNERVGCYITHAELRENRHDGDTLAEVNVREDAIEVVA